MKTKTEACGRCKRLFEYPGFGYKYCPLCKEIDNKQFDLVREYIYENGTATMVEIVEETGVQQKYIMQYLRESRLEIPENSPVFIRCDKCGCNIRSGKYCMDCVAKMAKDLNSMSVYYDAGEKPKEKQGAMHFLGKESDNQFRRKK